MQLDRRDSLRRLVHKIGGWGGRLNGHCRTAAGICSSAATARICGRAGESFWGKHLYQVGTIRYVWDAEITQTRGKSSA